MKIIKLLLPITITLCVTACNGFFDKDNTPPPSPLVNFHPEVRIHPVWSTTPTDGVGKDYLCLLPAMNDHAIYTAGKNGVITATHYLTGKQLWRTDTRTYISSGPAANNNLVVVGGPDGEVLALSAIDGRTLWRTKVSSELLAAPALSSNLVIIKSIDGHVSGLSTVDGHAIWHYRQTEPTLILRRASTPQVSHNHVLVGFSNGNLAKLSLNDGSLYWEQPLAIPEGSFAIQRMIDVDADPIVVDSRIYAATYQGRISELDYNSGKSNWTNDISSYTGLAADQSRVFVTDAKSHVWAFNSVNGRVEWRQTELEARNITGPANFDQYIVVGDEEGYIHLINKSDGRFAARTRVNSSGILATPAVRNHLLYILTKDGHLSAYQLG